MRRSPTLALALAATLAVALAPGAARAEEATAAPQPAATSAAAPPTADVVAGEAAPTATDRPLPAPAPPRGAGLRRPLPLLGVSLGGGFPDLVNANLLVRPVPWLRLYAGPCWSYVSWGVQGGVVLAPWSFVVTPTLSLQAGKLFGTSLRRFVRSDSQSAQDIKPLLGDVDFQYLAGDLGLEIGSPRGLAFYLRLGLSFVELRANGTTTHTSSDGTRVTLRDPSLGAWMPSANLGLQYWF